MYTGLHVKYPLIFADFNETLIFSTIFEIQISNFMKIRPVGAGLFHADGHRHRGKDGQTDMTKLIVAFRNSANAPIKSVSSIMTTNRLIRAETTPETSCISTASQTVDNAHHNIINYSDAVI